MSEFYRVPKIIGTTLAAGIGLSALSGCGEGVDTWEVGVVCAGDAKVQIETVDNDAGYTWNDGRITIDCVDSNGTSNYPQSMELIKGDNGAVINNSRDYSDIVRIQYHDEFDSYSPQIDLFASLGQITTDNVQIKSAAIVE